MKHIPVTVGDSNVHFQTIPRLITIPDSKGGEMATEVLTDEAVLLAYRLRELREKTFQTAKDAAAAFNATPSQWTNWESATVTPFKSTLEKFADFFKVDIEYFSQKPENWNEEKRDFLAKLRRHARKNKDRYRVPDMPSPTSDAEQRTAERTGDGDIFLEIASLINDARNQAKKGMFGKETYIKNMKFLSDLIELASEHIR